MGGARTPVFFVTAQLYGPGPARLRHPIRCARSTLTDLLQNSSPPPSPQHSVRTSDSTTPSPVPSTAQVHIACPSCRPSPTPTQQLQQICRDRHASRTPLVKLVTSQVTDEFQHLRNPDEASAQLRSRRHLTKTHPQLPNLAHGRKSPRSSQASFRSRSCHWPQAGILPYQVQPQDLNAPTSLCHHPFISSSPSPTACTSSSTSSTQLSPDPCLKDRPRPNSPLEPLYLYQLQIQHCL